MRTSKRISRVGWVVAAAWVLALNGCGSSTESSTAAHGKKTAAKPKALADPARRDPADMVAAVSATKTGAPVQLKFELRQRPGVGQPLDVDIALIPGSPLVERVYAKFQPGEGMDLLDGGDLAPVEKPAEGVPIRHTVRVLPKRDGIFTVTATVGVDSATDSVARAFAIPVIAGEGLPELGAKSEVAAGQLTPGTGFKTH
ncbi:MAG: hypothetical protein JWN85_3133 [Gammaproteobacteria bacterium]|nr:hypothetical protein [Gammaproteobacteria bacterium]